MQTDLSFRMIHMSESTLFHVTARIFNITAINNQSYSARQDVTLRVRSPFRRLFRDNSLTLSKEKKSCLTRYCMAVTPTAVRSQAYGTPLPISLTSICGHLDSLITIFVHKFEQIY